jgi:hypothetical protein
MRYFANPSNGPVLDVMRAGQLGMIDTPAQGNALPTDVNWCADNGCFSAGYPGDDGYLAWLARRTDRAARCAFATAPDVVSDAAATLTRSAPLLPRIRQLGYPAALVAQNGIENLTVPWDTFDVLFLGGGPECLPCRYIRPATDRATRHCPHCGRPLVEWKLGGAASRLTAEARRRGKQVHMGRVNSETRIRYARKIGCHSADGTYLTYGPDTNLPKLLAWLRRIDHPGMLRVRRAPVAPSGRPGLWEVT